MFFFSAATYNGHRIHYDKDWARDVEGYDNVLVQGPLQAALLSRALTDWIGGGGRLVAFSVQNRAIAYPGEELTFGGVVTGKRLTDSGPAWWIWTSSAGAATTVLMPGTATVALPLTGRVVTGLRGEAAIIGIAELPAERRQSRPPSFTLDQYALLAKLVIEDAGVDPAVVNGLSCHGIAESAMFAPATLCEYLGLPLDFGDRVDLGGATAAAWCGGPRPPSNWGSATRCWRWCPDRSEMPRSRAAARARPRIGTGRRATTTAPRRPSSRSRTATWARTRRTRRSLSVTPPNSATIPRPLAKIAVDQRTNACAHPGAVFHGKPITVDDVLDSPMIADPIHMLETVMRVQGGAGVLIANADMARRGPPSPGVDQGLRRAHRRSRPPPTPTTCCARRSPAPPTRRSRWRGCSRPTSTSPRSTTATPSPC